MLDSFDIFVPVGLLIIVVTFFAYLYFGGRNKHKLEKGKTPLFQERCGGRFGIFNLTAPLARHTIYDDFSLIGYGKRKLILYDKDITSVALEKSWFSMGLSYSHNRSDLPATIIVWSLSPETVMNILKQKNIDIAES